MVKSCRFLLHLPLKCKSIATLTSRPNDCVLCNYERRFRLRICVVLALHSMETKKCMQKQNKLLDAVQSRSHSQQLAKKPALILVPACVELYSQNIFEYHKAKVDYHLSRHFIKSRQMAENIGWYCRIIFSQCVSGVDRFFYAFHLKISNKRKIFALLFFDKILCVVKHSCRSAQVVAT